jgi:hypothetical protein
MPGQSEVPADDSTQPPPLELSDEIASSLGSVWARYTGARPKDSAVEVDGRVVRWELPGGTEDLTTGLAATDENGDARTMTGFRRATFAAVTKVTHRKVAAHTSKQDKKTGATSETFILEAITKKY